MENADARLAMAPSKHLRRSGAAIEVVASRLVSSLQDCFPEVVEALVVASARRVRAARVYRRVAVS